MRLNICSAKHRIWFPTVFYSYYYFFNQTLIIYTTVYRVAGLFVWIIPSWRNVQFGNYHIEWNSSANIGLLTTDTALSTLLGVLLFTSDSYFFVQRSTHSCPLSTVNNTRANEKLWIRNVTIRTIRGVETVIVFSMFSHVIKRNQT